MARLQNRQSGQNVSIGGHSPAIVILTIIILVFVFVGLDQLYDIELVAEYGSDAAKALYKLITFGGLVRDKFQRGSKVLVLLGEPFQKGTLVDDVHLLAGSFVHELITVLFLGLVGVQDYLGTVGRFQRPSSYLKVLVDNDSVGCGCLQSPQSVLNTVTYFAGILANFVKVLTDKLLLLNELDVSKGLGSKFNGLVEAIFSAIGDIDNLDDLGLEAIVEHVRLIQVILEVGRAGQNQARAVNLVVRDEILDSQLGNLADIVVAFFLTQTSETKSRLSSTAMLFGKIDGEFVDNIPGVAAQSSEESSVSIQDDEAEFLIRLE